LDDSEARSAAFSLDAEIDRAGTYTKTRDLEAIHALGKQGIEGDRATVGSDRETEHRPDT
jgi:hypothetical protein